MPESYSSAGASGFPRAAGQFVSGTISAETRIACTFRGPAGMIAASPVIFIAATAGEDTLTVTCTASPSVRNVSGLSRVPFAAPASVTKVCGRFLRQSPECLPVI